MALIDRVGPSGDISSHSFSAGIYLVTRGIVTRQQLVDRFGLTPQDEVQLDQLAVHYSGLNAENKAAFHGRFESLNILREEEYITLVEYKNLLGLT
jgi:hypothetical protein